jgi:hypothetical protein
MSQTFTTHSGSRYELDPATSRIRRLSGSHDPTPRQGPDGAWRTYEALGPLEVGAQLVVVWRTGDDGVAECTVTSPVATVASPN